MKEAQVEFMRSLLIQAKEEINISNLSIYELRSEVFEAFNDCSDELKIDIEKDKILIISNDGIGAQINIVMRGDFAMVSAITAFYDPKEDKLLQEKNKDKKG